MSTQRPSSTYCFILRSHKWKRLQFILCAFEVTSVGVNLHLKSCGSCVGGATAALYSNSIVHVAGELWTAVTLACSPLAVPWHWSSVTTDDATSTSLFDPPHVYFPDSIQCLHHRLSRQTKAIQVFLVWFGSGPPKTNTCKPYNMVICSGWVKERRFINNGANRAHIELRFGFWRETRGAPRG